MKRENGTLLRTLDLLTDLDPRDLEPLEAKARTLAMPKGSWLFLEGHAQRHVWVVARGTIQLSRAAAAAQFLVERAVAGASFAEEALLDVAREDIFAVAIEESLLVALPAGELAGVLDSRPAVRERLRLLRLLRPRTRVAIWSRGAIGGGWVHQGADAGRS